jgi:branched-chain amino acid aminotransferase
MQNEIYHNTLIYNSQLVDKSIINNINFNDGVMVYEVIRIIENVPLFFEEHLMRLHFSANLTANKITMSDSEILHSIQQLIIENQISTGNIKLMIQFKNNGLSSFFCFFIKHNYPTDLQYENGIIVKLFSNERQNPAAKIINTNFKKESELFINESLIYEALLVNKNGWITEGSKSNVFFIKGNLLFTAPKSMILSGITRKFVLKSAHLSYVDVIEECINQKDIHLYDAAFISGTSPKILPISSIENVNYNVNNPILRKIMSDYDDEIDIYIKKNC